MFRRTTDAFRLYVANIPWTVSNKQLKEHFNLFGTVSQVNLQFEKETGFHKGFGFIHFLNEEALNKALNYEAHWLEGKKLILRRKV
jgi:RNA recognition motif-containing protein